MKKVLSVIISLILIITALLPLANVSASTVDQKAWLDSQPDGSVVFVPNFNGEDGVYEPGLLKGSPQADVDPNNPNTFTFQTTKNKTASYWGGFIETLPLDETTCYTIYYTVTRTGDHSVGVYCDSIYGAYGYPARIKLMYNGSSLTGHEYMYFESLGIDAPKLDTSMVTHEYALEVNGINTKLATYIKDNSGKYVLVDESQEGEIPYFGADVLGLFFYSYYANHIVTISDCYIVKGLSFGTATIPETTPEPETTKAPETTKPEETTKAEETTSEPEANTTEAPETPNTPVVTKAPETTPAPEKSGCSSTIAPCAILAIIGCAAPVLLRKKRR